MLAEKITAYYCKDYNCAEATLSGANEAYGLGLDEAALKLVGGFGGGFGCEITCGALCGAMAVLSALAITEHAHATPGFKAICAEYVALFEKEVGSVSCRELKKKYLKEGKRCQETVERNAALLETYVETLREKGIGG